MFTPAQLDTLSNGYRATWNQISDGSGEDECKMTNRDRLEAATDWLRDCDCLQTAVIVSDAIRDHGWDAVLTELDEHIILTE